MLYSETSRPIRSVAKSEECTVGFQHHNSLHFNGSVKFGNNTTQFRLLYIEAFVRKNSEI